MLTDPFRIAGPAVVSFSGAGATSLCDRCTKPGRCCSGFALNLQVFEHETSLDVMVKLARVEHRDCRGRPIIGTPFLPLYRTPRHWRFWCPLLGRDGRCTDYENRPEVCAIFEPGADSLCVMHAPADATPASLPGPGLGDSGADIFAACDTGCGV